MRIKYLSIFFLFFGCSTLKFIKYEKEKELRTNAEFEKQVIVKEFEPVAEILVVPEVVPKDESFQLNHKKSDSSIKISLKKEIKKKQSGSNKILNFKTDTVQSVPLVRQPEIENNEGFNGQRRPANDPFKTGERTTHAVSYFGAQAAIMNLEILPLIEVNSKKSYHFDLKLKTSRLFSSFYSVDNRVETFIDFDLLVPVVHKYNARESGKLVQSNSFFDHEKLVAQFWEKKYTEKNGEEKKELKWKILPFSQNAFSAIFYIRIFPWTIGQEYTFRVADDEKNIVFKGKAIAKEKLSTDAGEFNAIKIKSTVVSRGALTQAGDLYVWLSDDDRKIVLRLEAEIKIGKIVSEISEYKAGK